MVNNCTDLTISKEEELRILKLDLKMSFVPNKPSLKDIIDEIESGITVIDYQIQYIPRK